MFGSWYRQSKTSSKSTRQPLRCESLEIRDVPVFYPVSHLLASSLTNLAVVSQPVAMSVTNPAVIGLNGTQFQRANRLISTFENSTPVLQYGYIENLDDGRGFTAGRAGFTTGTGDLLLVVERFTKLEPYNGLLRYLPRLRELAASGSDSTEGLVGFERAWQQRANLPKLQQAQNQISNDLYYTPAKQLARDLGAKNPLTLVALYDTAIQHGVGDDPDGLPAIIERTNQAMGGTPDSGIDEKDWLASFLDQREETLNNPDNKDTQAAWQQSVDRVHVVRGFLQAGNVSFHGPLRYTVYGDSFVLS